MQGAWICAVDQNKIVMLIVITNLFAKLFTLIYTSCYFFNY